MDAQLTEVNHVVVSKEQVFFSDRLLRAGEVYTIRVEKTMTQFVPAGGFIFLFVFHFLRCFASNKQINHHSRKLRYGIYTDDYAHTLSTT